MEGTFYNPWVRMAEVNAELAVFSKRDIKKQDNTTKLSTFTTRTHLHHFKRHLLGDINYGDIRNSGKILFDQMGHGS